MALDDFTRRLIEHFWLITNNAARSALGLQVYGFAVIFLKPIDSAALFQLLLLQSAIAVVMTGSGYVRGAAAHQRGEIRRSLVGVTCLSTILVFGLIAADIFARDQLRQIAPYEMGETWALLMIGAGCSAIATTVQGIFAAAGHRRAAFAPGAIAAICGAIYMALGDVTVHSLAEAWCFYQIASLILIAPFIVPLIGRVIVSEQRMKARAVGSEISTAAQIGLFGAASMLAVYFFRERWRVEAETQVVELVFFALRFSDLFFQFVFYAFALGQRGSFAQRVRKIDAKRTISSIALWLVVIAGSAMLLNGEPYTLNFILPLAVIHIGMDTARLFSSWACIDALRELSPLRYLLVTVAPYAMGAGIVWIVAGFDHSAALYIFLASAAGLQCMFAFLALNRAPNC